MKKEESEKVSDDGITFVTKKEDGIGMASIKVDMEKCGSKDEALKKIRKAIAQIVNKPEEEVAIEMKQMFDDLDEQFNKVISMGKLSKEEISTFFDKKLMIIESIDKDVTKLCHDMGTLYMEDKALFLSETVQIMHFLLKRFSNVGRLHIIKDLVNLIEKDRNNAEAKKKE